MYKNPKNAHKNAQKCSKNSKPSIDKVVSTGTNFAKKAKKENAFFVRICCVRFSRYIVVKGTDAIFFRTVEWRQLKRGKIVANESRLVEKVALFH